MKAKLLSVLSLSVLLAACASSKTSTLPAPKYTPAEQTMLDGLKADFDGGKYKTVIKDVKATPETESGTPAFRLEALKYKAFSECVLKMKKSCRATFRTLFSENPNFALDVTEENHPQWGPIYKAEKKRADALAQKAEATSKKTKK